MAKQSNYPVSFYFKLNFKGEDFAFKEVSGISKEINVEEVVSGGENRFKYRLPKINTSQNLVLKRGIVTKGSELINWCTSTMEEGLVNPIVTHDISVNLLSPEDLVLIEWTFHDAYPVKYSISDLRSEENTLVFETIEFAYTFFDITPRNPESSTSDLFG